jgi:hypothetical protein
MSRQPIVVGSRVRYKNAHLLKHRWALGNKAGDSGIVTELLPGRNSLRVLVLWEDSHTTWEVINCLEPYSNSRLA